MALLDDPEPEGDEEKEEASPETAPAAPEDTAAPAEDKPEETPSPEGGQQPPATQYDVDDEYNEDEFDFDEEEYEEEETEEELKLRQLKADYQKIADEIEEINKEIDTASEQLEKLQAQNDKKKTASEEKKLTKQLSQARKKLDKLVKDAKKLQDKMPDEKLPPLRIAVTMDERSMPVEWQNVLKPYANLGKNECLSPDPNKDGLATRSPGVKVRKEFCNIPDPDDIPAPGTLITGGKRCPLDGYVYDDKKDEEYNKCNLENLFSRKAQSSKRAAKPSRSTPVKTNAEFCEQENQKSNEYCGMLITRGKRKELWGRNKKCDDKSSK